MGNAFKQEVDAKEVEKLAPYLNMEQLADYFGICYKTLERQCVRNPAIKSAYKRGKARAIGVIAESLVSKARKGNEKCMIFFLKTQAGWRETDRPEDIPNSQLDNVLEIVRAVKPSASVTDETDAN